MTVQDPPVRLHAIDVLRALTMFLMVFVNDLWTLTGVPKWLEHATIQEDYLGFSDIIFPLFLFIVGLSIPLAIQNRQRKGDAAGQIIRHILVRGVSLLIMGFFMVNKSHGNTDLMVISTNWWMFFMATGLALVWMDWKRSTVPSQTASLLQGLGMAILLFLMIVFKGGKEGDQWMRPYWWGILGLIGWAYLINALIFVFSRGKLWIIAACWVLFNLLSIANQLEWIPDFGKAGVILSHFTEGTLSGFSAGGMLATLLFQHFHQKDKINLFYLSMLLLGIGYLAFGFLIRPEWGISKLRSTPSWLAICSSIGFLLFGIMYWLADIKGKVNWFKIIAPAGTATLTCYLIPYFWYSLREIIPVHLPDFLRADLTGIVKSIVYALLVVMVTGILQHFRLKLKL